jgi:hypothetical protein
MSAHRNFMIKLSGQPPQPWGFVVYRTTYDDEEAWKRAKNVLLQLKEEDKEAIEDERGDPDTGTLKIVEDEKLLKDKTAKEVRLYVIILNA